MTLRRFVAALISIALGGFLVLLLARIAHINWQETLQQLRDTSWMAFVELVLLNVMAVYLSTAKWRSVDSFLRRPGDVIPSQVVSISLTSIGMAIGLLVPVQLGMTVARTLGTYVHGSPLRRGTVGTLLEQSFDVLTVFILAIASAFTLMAKGGATTWVASALVLILLCFTFIGPLVRWVRRFTASEKFPKGNPDARFGKLLTQISEMASSPVFDPALAQKLVILSTLRYATLVLMTAQTAHMIGASIPLWQLAAAGPVVVAASVLAITPGGIGVNELTYATVLRSLGTPLAAAAQWAIANRVLATASCFAVAAIAATYLIVQSLLGKSAAVNADL